MKMIIDIPDGIVEESIQTAHNLNVGFEQYVSDALNGSNEKWEERDNEALTGLGAELGKKDDKKDDESAMHPVTYDECTPFDEDIDTWTETDKALFGENEECKEIKAFENISVGDNILKIESGVGYKVIGVYPTEGRSSRIMGMDKKGEYLEILRKDFHKYKILPF